VHGISSPSDIYDGSVVRSPKTNIVPRARSVIPVAMPHADAPEITEKAGDFTCPVACGLPAASLGPD